MSSFVTNPVTVSVKKENTTAHVDQDIVRLSPSESKIDVLHDLLIKPDLTKVIIFGKTKWGMEKLSRALSERGFTTSAIHGNKTQNQRMRALDDFKKGRIKILLATSGNER